MLAEDTVIKYFKSLLFDFGLVLIVAGLLFGKFAGPRITRTIEGVTSGAENYDITAPAGLVVTGLLFAIIGATKANSDLEP